MKAPSVSLLLGLPSLLVMLRVHVSAVSLDISPNLQQFFTGDSSVSLRCVEDGQTAEGWTVKRTRGGSTEESGAVGPHFNGSSCVLDMAHFSGGVFWCETKSGQRSNNVTLQIGHRLILEIPALPVKAGSDVILRCKRQEGVSVKAYFFMNGKRLRPEPRSEHKLSGVQLSHQGSYHCSTDMFGKSPESFLTVTESAASLLPSSTPAHSTGSAEPNPAVPPPTSILLSVVAAMAFMVLVIIGVVTLCSRKGGAAGGAAGGQPSPVNDVIYADITIRPAAARRADPQAVYAAVRSQSPGS